MLLANIFSQKNSEEAMKLYLSYQMKYAIFGIQNTPIWQHRTPVTFPLSSIL